MIEFVEQGNKKNLILFIHGFGGGESTWENEGNSFPKLLAADEEIKKNYDIAVYTYFTKLLNLYQKAQGFGTLLKRLFTTSHGKLVKNISIEEIGDFDVGIGF